jgi:hypothetical protein
VTGKLTTDQEKGIVIDYWNISRAKLNSIKNDNLIQWLENE